MCRETDAKTTSLHVDRDISYLLLYFYGCKFLALGYKGVLRHSSQPSIV